MANSSKQGQQFVRRVPDGDNRERSICEGCGWVDYENPKVVVGAVCVWDDKVLLCRRGIEPRRGHWTIPAGYLELGESTSEGAAREVREEALAEVAIGPLVGLYSIPRISQVVMIYRATMRTEDFGVGEETLDARLFEVDNIPWDDLAFPSVKWALTHYILSRDRETFPPFASPAHSGPLPANGEPLK